MNDFYHALAYIHEMLYISNQLLIEDIQEETQNADYGAGIFQLNAKSIRFRVAKITPRKIGQFVAFWEKDENHKNQPFSDATATDLLVINTFTTDNRWGQFIFPKEVLLQQHILQTATIKGKMAIRVFPHWEKPTSKQAIYTQQWQLNYFVEINDQDPLAISKLLKLYLC